MQQVLKLLVQWKVLSKPKMNGLGTVYVSIPIGTISARITFPKIEMDMSVIVGFTTRFCLGLILLPS